MTSRQPPAVTIATIEARPLDTARRAAVEAIFFEASATRSWPDAAAREAFAERWLGRYLREDPRWFFVAEGPDGHVLGYLAGALDDPALAGRFADIGYFAALAPLTARFPAHLHVNVAQGARGMGIGAHLVERFLAQASAAGAIGVHVVTGASSRNLSFYQRNGFGPLAVLDWNGTPIAMLGRPLGGASPG
ncbi:MAG: GNAT family N-acetyltransferase [Hyphomicrobiaceae bacterium]|nr:GNAT family N-acetyltransferase [Hyphomicrobiaceae bacterium]